MLPDDPDCEEKKESKPPAEESKEVQEASCPKEVDEVTNK